MKMHTVTIEIAEKNPTADRAEQLLEQLPELHAAVSVSERGWVTIDVTLPAEHVRQAVLLAIAAVEQASGRPALAVAAMTEEEADAREGWETLPDLVSVTEAAELLGGISRQAVLDRIARRTLPATKVGREYVIPRSALTK
ncbi:helix-turn-helix domain-containing protein [Pimelobacter simplex]|uniref:helix-turn-helix domain-containing protein n=1 Tax=Nocardioides simplex TaxID=2045 RepID=UPI002150669C|nr:helix-turn-helix domain-containing protein [Pimelobacter simplex]UUW88386.1 helix-turn-helix domain-containing protein [Pimelobacter simplex]UUW97890.1 helix-turn-helix domain-containing protein [Pimelobacter simplex]